MVLAPPPPLPPPLLGCAPPLWPNSSHSHPSHTPSHTHPSHTHPSRVACRHAIESHLDIKAGETSADGLWTLTEVECLGACVNAPMIQVNDMFFEDLTPESTVKLLDDLAAGNEVVIGPQNGRINSLGPMGRTSLVDAPVGPQCRELPAPFVPPA